MLIRFSHPSALSADFFVVFATLYGWHLLDDAVVSEVHRPKVFEVLSIVLLAVALGSLSLLL